VGGYGEWNGYVFFEYRFADNAYIHLEFESSAVIVIVIVIIDNDR
jgi:hypothetical protein